jgi:uncharacterized repeat protein (TIGR02059 family)
MKLSLGMVLLLATLALDAQTSLTIEGRTYTNTADTWEGVDIPRTSKTSLIFRNNTITSKNRYGYMLQAGDEGPAATNNNLDGAVITGNMFEWSGTDFEVIPHGVFTGHNSNVLIKYNYLSHVPMGIIRKSGNNMGNTGGGVAYNIVKGGGVSMVVKGMSNVNIFNNTFFGDRNADQTWRPLVHVYTNTDGGLYSVSHGTRIYNNIFYTRHRTPVINIADNESLTGLESDYNLFWCEDGPLLFQVNGENYTFEEWQALGYDQNSVVVDPRFGDLESFIPQERLDYGRDLGSSWALGLSIHAEWGKGSPIITRQNGPWQVGAVIHGDDVAQNIPRPRLLQAVVQGDRPAVIEMTFSQTLANVVPDSTSFKVNINSMLVTVTSVSVEGRKVLLTLGVPVTHDDKVTVSYDRPAQNPLQGLDGELARAEGTQIVVVNIPNSTSVIKVFPNPAKDFFNISNTGNDNLPQVIKIYDLSGKIRYEKRLETDFLHRVEVNLNPGVYFLHLEVGSAVTHKQKLIIVE